MVVRKSKQRRSRSSKRRHSRSKRVSKRKSKRASKRKSKKRLSKKRSNKKQQGGDAGPFHLTEAEKKKVYDDSLVEQSDEDQDHATTMDMTPKTQDSAPASLSATTQDSAPVKI